MYPPFVRFMVHTCLVGESTQIFPVKVREIFCQFGLEPNCWTKHYLHEDTSARHPFLKTPQMLLIKDREPVNGSTSKHREKKTQNSPPSCLINNGHNNATNVYYCRRHEDLVIDDKTYTMAGYFPCFGQFADDVKNKSVSKEQGKMIENKVKVQQGRRC